MSRYLNKLMACTFAFLGAASVFANETPLSESDIEIIQQKLSAHVVASGNFQQTRTVKSIPRPLVSTGTFVVWSQHGIYWQTVEPFFSATTYTTSDIIDWNNNYQALPANKSLSTIQKYINEVMVALIEVNNEALEKYFSIQWQGTVDNWHLELTPRRSAVKRNIKSIQLNGSDSMESLHLLAPEGDATEILFSNFTDSDTIASEYCPRFFRTASTACSN